MGVFSFKRFDVSNEQSTMKVGTDGVLLGAAVSICAADRRVLDAGTGTGTIALMLAQRYSDIGASPEIEGIDIDGPSAREAALNFASSPWSETMCAKQCPLGGYRPSEPFDLIVSNPPYFEDALLPPEKRRATARHAGGDAMSFGDLAAFAAEYLSAAGRMAVILPAASEKANVRVAAAEGLYPQRLLRVRTTPRKDFSRVVMEFARSRSDLVSEESLILQENGPTEAYRALVKDFYLWA